MTPLGATVQEAVLEPSARGGRIAAGGGLFAGGSFAGGLFASGLNAATPLDSTLSAANLRFAAVTRYQQWHWKTYEIYTVIKS